MPPMLFYLKEIRHNVKVNYGNPNSRDSMLDPDLRSSPPWNCEFYSQRREATFCGIESHILFHKTESVPERNKIVRTRVKSTIKAISVRSTGILHCDFDLMARDPKIFI